MRRFEARPSLTKIAGLMLLSLVMIGMCAFCIVLPDLNAKIAGWVGLVFFGFCLCVFIWSIFQANVVKIAMDDDGIHTGSSLGLVEWSDVTGFRIDSIHGTQFLSIFVHDVTKYLDRMPPLARRSAEAHPHMGLSELTLCFVGLSPGLPDACHFLAERGFVLEKWQ